MQVNNGIIDLLKAMCDERCSLSVVTKEAQQYVISGELNSSTITFTISDRIELRYHDYFDTSMYEIKVPDINDPSFDPDIWFDNILSIVKWIHNHVQHNNIKQRSSKNVD